MMRIGKDPLVQKNDLLMSRLYFDYAELKIKQRDFSEALRALEQAYRSKPSLDIALKLAVIWATGGQYEQSYRWLMMARLHDEARLMFVPSRAPELDKLERIIGSRLKASGVDVPAAVNLAEPPFVPDE
jgi:tetratricopeptide (TPR) repeat protein